ncbi:LysR family transcriptional regulator [Amycolatopsis sp. CA-230715]|uniref:LysR family transcriptional regulator n=1 Tax=Amycolatopsis sp. CA-230715 TaxID=2745196 RepID=UPI001C024FD6|nr:LysR family transcriptional regulator [Amycolatopsis sp. CA-230715]QWF78526.1 HTH-type transcriptional regulator GltC [Amycolatopsis sp. CA-230715]
MELRQLTHFLAVAERRHFTKAAGDLHLTQSSLSSSIRALERELGGDLFVRSTRRVELTEAGRALLPAARRAVEAAEAGRDAVAGVHGLLRGTLTVGAIQTLGMVDLPAVLTRYHRRHPAVGLRVRHDSVRGLVHATVTGELDLAFVDRPLGPDADRVRAHRLGSESLVLAVAANDPLAHRAKVRIAELGDADFVEYRADSALRASIDRATREAGLRRRICCEVDTITDQVELVATGLGVALLPPLALRTAGERVAGVPTEPAIGREQVVVLARDREPSQAAVALLDLLPSLRAATS